MKLDAETIKTLFRPFLTLLLVSAWIVFIAKSIEYPPIFQYVAVGAVLEWIGERGLKRFKELLK